LDAATAGSFGYESLSQFSCEYGRLLGAPPARATSSGCLPQAAARMDARDEAWRKAAGELARPE